MKPTVVQNSERRASKKKTVKSPEDPGHSLPIRSKQWLNPMTNWNVRLTRTGALELMGFENDIIVRWGRHDRWNLRLRNTIYTRGWSRALTQEGLLLTDI